MLVMKDFNKIHLLTAIVLSLATFGHFYRLVSNSQFILDEWNMPLWLSVVAMFVAGGLSIYFCLCLKVK